MSYEGRIQLWCAVGCYHELDCNRPMPQKCGCGEDIVFRNGVDDTNCDEWGYIKPDFIDVPAGNQRKCATVPTDGTPRYFRELVDPYDPDKGYQWVEIAREHH